MLCMEVLVIWYRKAKGETWIFNEASLFRNVLILTPAHLDSMKRYGMILGRGCGVDCEEGSEGDSRVQNRDESQREYL